MGITSHLLQEIAQAVGRARNGMLLARFVPLFIGTAVRQAFFGCIVRTNDVKGSSGLSTQPFPVFSAIEAQAGNLDHAIRIYAITAFNEEEKRSVQTLYELLDKGKLDFIQAEIFRLNDDFHSAIRTLQQASGDSDADHFILSDYLLAFRWEEALRLLDRIGVPADERHLADMLRGTIQLIRGGRHKAVQSFLRGAVSDWRALNSIAEVEQWDQATRSVLGGLYDDSRADSQNDG